VQVAIIVINKSDAGVEDTVASLTALAEVRRGDAEVIVVDASEGRFDHVRDRFPSVRWTAFTPIPGRPSIPHQRNRGVAATAAETVVFIDASCLPGPDWLERLCAPIREEGESVVAGSHRSPSGAGLRDLATDRLANRTYLTEAPTINLAVRRSVLAALDGFDESFRYGSDVDFTWRAIDAGYRIRYVPDAWVTHEWGGLREELQRSYSYGRARGHLYFKHRRRWRGLLWSDSPALAYPLLLIASPLFLVRRRLLLALLIPLARNRGRRPVLTLAEHCVYGAGVLRAVASWAGNRLAGASER
jgi:GT2 family glycosyltransferase